MNIPHRPLLCLALAAFLPALATAQAIPADQPYDTARDQFNMTVEDRKSTRLNSSHN